MKKYKFNNKTSEKYLLQKFMNDISSTISSIFSKENEINIDELSKENFRPYLNYTQTSDLLNTMGFVTTDLSDVVINDTKNKNKLNSQEQERLLI